MIRGTTPTHIFALPFSTDLVKKCNILYAQADGVVLKKNEANCILTGNEISVKLTQEETMRFDSDKTATVQLHVLTTGEEALVSDISILSVKNCLDDEVLK